MRAGRHPFTQSHGVRRDGSIEWSSRVKREPRQPRPARQAARYFTVTCLIVSILTSLSTTAMPFVTRPIGA